jgi:hypothetical protein
MGPLPAFHRNSADHLVACHPGVALLFVALGAPQSVLRFGRTQRAKFELVPSPRVRENSRAVVAMLVPASHVATLSGHRLTLSRRSPKLRRGEVRRVRL